MINFIVSIISQTKVFTSSTLYDMYWLVPSKVILWQKPHAKINNFLLFYTTAQELLSSRYCVAIKQSQQWEQTYASYIWYQKSNLNYSNNIQIVFMIFHICKWNGWKLYFHYFSSKSFDIRSFFDSKSSWGFGHLLVPKTYVQLSS